VTMNGPKTTGATVQFLMGWVEVTWRDAKRWFGASTLLRAVGEMRGKVQLDQQSQLQDSFSVLDFALQILLSLSGWVQVTWRDAKMWLGTSTLLRGRRWEKWVGRWNLTSKASVRTAFQFSGFCLADFVVTVRVGPGDMEGCPNEVGGINFASWEGGRGREHKI
jgi:hypothetical protein